MNKRILGNQTGATLIDFFIIVGIVIVLGLSALKLDDVYQASFRKQCYSNQQSLEHVLHEILLDHENDLYQVLVAYTIYDPLAEEKFRMIIVLHPILLDPFSWMGWYKELKEAGATPKVNPVIVTDLTRHPYANRILCPLRHEEMPDRATVDYWYVPMQRWYCMHNKYHN